MPYFFVFKDTLSGMFNDPQKASQYKSKFLKRLVDYYSNKYYDDIESIKILLKNDDQFLTIIPLLAIGGVGTETALKIASTDKKSLHVLSSFLNSLSHYLWKSEYNIDNVFEKFLEYELKHRKKYHKGTKLFEDIVFTLILYTYMYLKVDDYVFFNSSEGNVYGSGIVDDTVSKVIGIINESYSCIYHKYNPLISRVFKLPDKYTMIICEKKYRVAGLKDLNLLFSLFTADKFRDAYRLLIPESALESPVHSIKVNESTGIIEEKRYKVSVYSPVMIIIRDMNTGKAIMYPLKRDGFTVFINMDKLQTPVSIEVKYGQGNIHVKTTLPWKNPEELIKI